MKEDQKTFLLVWNPKRWTWKQDHLKQTIKQVKQGGLITDRWSCGNSKQLKVGDRVFLIRLGEDPKGIFASGWTTSDSVEGSHWDRERAALGDTTQYVKFEYDTLLDPMHETILPREILKSDPKFSKMHWDAQMSGTRIPDNIATEVELEWSNLTDVKYCRFLLPEEILHKEILLEGSTRTIFVNVYERSTKARRQCIAHHGSTCVVCDMSFEKTYGSIGKDFIHVHHLIPLAEIRQEYIVDPIKDLRPVCPNCHAMIHSQKPAFSIEEMKNLLIKHGEK